METTSSIRERALKCKKLFRQCEACPALGRLDWVQSGQGDFNLWCYALRATSTGKSSLDYRVRERADVRQIICDLLDGLEESLQECLKKASTTTQALASQDLSGDEDETLLILSEDQDEIDGPFSEQIFDIKTILDQLTRIHIAIRRSGAKLRHHRADSSLSEALKLPEMQEFKESMTQVILLGLEDRTASETEEERKAKASDSLNQVQERLIHANLVRRNRILFATRDMQALAKKKKEQELERLLQETRKKIMESQQRVTPAQYQGDDDRSASPDNQDSTPPPATTTPGPVPVSTIGAPSESNTATDIAPDFKPDIRPKPTVKKPPTVITIATQICGSQDYPRCPKRPKSGELSPCPYCAELLDADYEKNVSRWRGHIASDILPYLCVYTTCRNPNELYATTEQLAKHVKEEHGVKRYICDHCSPPLAFEDSEDWEAHTQSLHFKKFRPAQLRLLAKMSMRTMVGSISCPLCSFAVVDAQPGLSEHILDHLHRFALRCLPWGSGGDGDLKSSEPTLGTKSELEDDNVSTRDIEELDVPSNTELVTGIGPFSDYLNGLENIELGVHIPPGNHEYQQIIANFKESKARLNAAIPSELVAIAHLEYAIPSLWKITQWWKELQAAGKELFATNDSSYRDLCEMMVDEVDVLAKTWKWEGGPAKDQMSAIRKVEKKFILDWLSPVDSALLQAEYSAQRFRKLGHWLLYSTKFTSWRLVYSPSLLFYVGKPGVGKTYIASLVIDDLLSEYKKDETVGILYVYCEIGRRKTHYLPDLIQNLLRQLLNSHIISDIPQSIKEAYSRYHGKAVEPTSKEMLNILISLIKQHYTRCFVVIDAPDECLGTDTTSFLSYLFELQDQTGANIFITSRPLPYLMNKAQARDNCIFINQEEHPASVQRDIHDYIYEFLVTRVHVPSWWFSGTPTLFQMVEVTVAEAASGSLLLARLYMESLQLLKSSDAIVSGLKEIESGSVPRGLEGVYAASLRRIRDQPADDWDLAKRIISFVTYSFRPLTTTELQFVLALAADTNDELAGNSPISVDDAISACCGLLEYAKKQEEDIVQFVHHTAQTYLRRTWRQWFPNAEVYITTICLQVLYTQNGLRSFNSNIELEHLLDSSPFFDYALRFFGDYCRILDDQDDAEAWDSLEGDFMRLLRDSNCLERCMQAIWYIKLGRDVFDSARAVKGMTGFHFVAYFGLSHLLNKDYHHTDDKDGGGRTPLSWAAMNGHEVVVEQLLKIDSVGDQEDAGVAINVDSKDVFDRTPLSLAAENGHSQIVKRLLGIRGVDADSKDCHGQTPLSWAAEKGHEAVVELLLNVDGVDPDSKHINGRTPLSWAAGNGHEAIVSLLLAASGVEIDSKNITGRTPLSWAAENGHDGVVRLLLSNFASPNVRDNVGQTPLSWAAENGHESIVKQLLVTSSVDAYSQDDYGRTPLFWAYTNGHASIVRLFESGYPAVHWL